MKEELTVEDPPLTTSNIGNKDNCMITKPVILKDVALGFFNKCCFLNYGFFTVLKINNVKGLGTNG